jgi:hypothetical protein
MTIEAREKARTYLTLQKFLKVLLSIFKRLEICPFRLNTFGYIFQFIAKVFCYTA